MRIFLAGATGAVGRLIVPMLIAEGHDVVGTSRTPEGLARLHNQGAGAVLMDAFDRDQVNEAVTSARPDLVMHQLTALADRAFAENSRLRREGTRNLVDAARAAGTSRIITQSISWVYGPGPAPAREDEPLDLDRELVASTKIMEDVSAELDRHVILRYGFFYGPGTWYFPGGWVAERIASGERPADDGISSFIHVADAARAAVLALDWPDGAYNVVDDEPAPARDWVPAFAGALGLAAPEPVAGGQPWERGADNAAARALGWKPAHSSWRTGFTSMTSGPEQA